MKDIKNNKIKTGDEVVFAPGGSYAGISLGIVEKFTPKKVRIATISGGKGRHVYGDFYYAYPEKILVIN